jgi:hypothetical protein
MGQIHNLATAALIRSMQAFGVASIFCAVACMFALFAGSQRRARPCSVSLVLLMVSLAISFREIQLSTPGAQHPAIDAGASSSSRPPASPVSVALQPVEGERAHFRSRGKRSSTNRRELGQRLAALARRRNSSASSGGASSPARASCTTQLKFFGGCARPGRARRVGDRPPGRRRGDSSGRVGRAGTASRDRRRGGGSRARGMVRRRGRGIFGRAAGEGPP